MLTSTRCECETMHSGHDCPRETHEQCHATVTALVRVPIQCDTCQNTGSVGGAACETCGGSGFMPFTGDPQEIVGMCDECSTSAVTDGAEIVERVGEGYA